MAQGTCTRKNRDGTPCQKLIYKGDPEDERCFTHFAKETGRKMPQEFRRKPKMDRTDRMLRSFGMKHAEIVNLRTAFPDVDEMVSKEHSYRDAMDQLGRALMIRLLAFPDEATAEALIAVSRFVGPDDVAPKPEEPFDAFADEG